MTTETTEIPQGVMEILRKRRGRLVDEMLLAQFEDATSEAGQANSCAVRARMSAVASLRRNSYYSPDEHRWIERNELVARSVARDAADWLSGLNAMRLAPWEN